jgi:hypothetical protein
LETVAGGARQATREPARFWRGEKYGMGRIFATLIRRCRGENDDTEEPCRRFQTNANAEGERDLKDC